MCHVFRATQGPTDGHPGKKSFKANCLEKHSTSGIFFIMDYMNRVYNIFFLL